MNTTTAAPTLPPCIFVVTDPDGTERETRSWDEAAQALTAAASAKGSTISLPVPGGGNTLPMSLDRAVAVMALSAAMRDPSPVPLERYREAAATDPHTLGLEPLPILAQSLAAAADRAYKARRDAQEMPRLEGLFGKPHAIVDTIKATAQLAHTALDQQAAGLWADRVAHMAAAEAAIKHSKHVVASFCGTPPALHVLKVWIGIALALYAAAAAKTGGRQAYDPAAALRLLKAAHKAITGEDRQPRALPLTLDDADVTEWLLVQLDRM